MNKNLIGRKQSVIERIVIGFMNSIIKDLILSDSWFLYEDKAYFSTVFTDCVFCADFSTKTVTMKGGYFNRDTFRLHPQCVVNNEHIYLLPDKANDIIVFDFDGNEKKRICIPNPSGVRIRIFEYYLQDNKIFLISRGLSAIIEFFFDEEKLNIYRISDNSKMIIGSTRMDNLIYLVTAGNSIYTFDTEDNSIGVVQHNEIYDELNVICSDGENLWLTGKKRNIYYMDRKTGNIKNYAEMPVELVVNEPGDDGEEHYLFYKAMSINGKIWFMHLYGDMDICFDPTQKTVKGVKVKNVKYLTYSEAKSSPLSVLLYLRDNRYIGKMVDASSEVYEIDTQTMQIVVKEFQVDWIIRSAVMNNCLLFENEGYRINEFAKDINV